MIAPMTPLGALDSIGTLPKREARPRARARVIAIAACGALTSALAAQPAGAQGANAPTKIECAKANGDAQALRNDGKLAAARAQLEMCEAAGCPAMVRDDCAQRMDELEHIQPTIVFDVKNAAGADVSGAAVTVDGAPLSGRLAGGALRVDPGEHAFTVTAAGQLALTRRLVIKEGEKDRRELIVLTVAPAPSASLPLAEPTGAGLGTQRVLGLTAGGVGIAAVAVGSIFGAQTFSAVSAQKKDCPTAPCQNAGAAASDHSSAVTDSSVSTAMFVAGAVLLAGGAVLFFTAPSRASHESAGLTVAPSVGPSGGGVTLQGRF
jgi:hypothetical protein